MTKSPAVQLSIVMDEVAGAEKYIDKWVYNTGIRDSRISDAHAALVKARVLLCEVVAEMAIQELID